MRLLPVPAPAGVIMRPAACVGVVLLAVGCGTATPPAAAAHKTMQSAVQKALEDNPSGELERWSDPDRGETGTVVPVRTFRANSGQACREYDLTVVNGDDNLQQRAVACRDDDGVWRDG